MALSGRDRENAVMYGSVTNSRESTMHCQEKRRPARLSTPAKTLAPVLGLLGVMLAVAPAAGGDSLICTIDDRALSLELNGSTSMSGDTRVYVRYGRLALKPGTFSNEPADIPIMQSNLILQWILGRSLRFAIHVDRGDRGGTVLLTILATRPEQSATYGGSYVLKLRARMDRDRSVAA
jgi:hypothetical protein